MELFYYIFVSSFGVLFSLEKSPIKNSAVFFAIWFLVYLVLVIIVRNKFDADINTYANSMSYLSISLYYLKEPVVWFGQRYVFGLTQDAFTVFVIYDVIFGVLLYKALRNLNVPQYVFFSTLVFFPFVLGMQNVYRQWIASILFLYSFSLIWNERNSFRAYSFFAFSFLAHNIAAVFFPLLLVRKRKAFGKLIWPLSFVVSFIGIYLGSSSKSSANTGADLSTAYLILLFFFICLVLLLDKGVIRIIRNFEYRLLLSLFVLSLSATLLLSSTGGERVSMFSLMIAYPILANLFEERFRQKVLIRVSFTVMGFTPMFLFSISKFIVE